MANPSMSPSNAEPGPASSGLDAWNRVSATGAEHEAEVLRRHTAFKSLIGRILRTDAHHLSLAELRSLVESRRQTPETWAWPNHLATCPLCLELFEALDHEEALSDTARTRYGRLWTQSMPSAERRWMFRPWLQPLPAIAAGLMIMAMGAWLLTTGAGRLPGNVLDGSGQLAAGNGAPLAMGAALPARQDIVTETGMNFSLADGSRITVAPQSRFRLITPWIGPSTLYLNHGDLKLSVTKQTLGRTLSVRTALGEVLVVGTQFRVKMSATDAVVFQQTAGNDSIRSYRERVRTMEVCVTEGAVKVRNAHDKVLVRAGYSAVLRGDQPQINLHPSPSESAP